MRKIPEKLKLPLLIGISFITGLVIGYLLAYYRLFGFLSVISIDFSQIGFFIANLPRSDFLSDLMALEAGLIGVAIPITLHVVTTTADRYKDPEIAQFFTKEKLYRSQFILLLMNIFTIVLLEFLGITHFVFLWGVFFMFIAIICIFYFFIRLVEQYATNMDKILRRKLKEYVENILKE
jgi:predicted membrane-bound spermidine synthase